MVRTIPVRATGPVCRDDRPLPVYRTGPLTTRIVMGIITKGLFRPESVVAADLIRTFVAIEIPTAVREVLDAALAPFRRAERLRWTQPAGWHLTLKFLGELAREDVRKVSAVCTRVASSLRPFEGALGGWGVFPSPHRPRVLWVGMQQGTEATITIAKAVEDALVDTGFPREGKPFHPHLTIARIEDPDAGTRAFAALQERPFASVAFRVNRIVVFQSVLDRGGARYHPLAVCSFPDT